MALVLTACAGADEAKILASDGAADDNFGSSVSISGDHAIVGAVWDDDNGVDLGSAYIYDIQTTEPPITGDLNGDDQLTPADAVIALKMAAGCCEPTTAADVSSDGVVNSLDALMILQAAVGAITL
ncbi:MAG: dockerin type I domain-containing protein [Euryarchaeota archaeon]|nr:dockerin type I domain-containing protein [Euryarchaeota archaeon]